MRSAQFQAALMAIGDDVFRRIATLAIACDLNTGRPAEILRMAFVRARFCELVSASCGLGALEQYLLGMFSMFPAMLNTHHRSGHLSVAVARGDPRCSARRTESGKSPAGMAGSKRTRRLGTVRCDRCRSSDAVAAFARCFKDAVLWTELTMSVSETEASGESRPGSPSGRSRVHA